MLERKPWSNCFLMLIQFFPVLSSCIHHSAYNTKIAINIQLIKVTHIRKLDKVNSCIFFIQTYKAEEKFLRKLIVLLLLLFLYLFCLLLFLFLAVFTECIVDLDNFTLVCWFGIRHKPIWDNDTANPIKNTHFKSGQNWLK